jgi:asparagine synthase (glutamine-hydrolysing)
MCGIAGIIDPRLTADQIRPIIQRMADAMLHRGPDDDGFFADHGIGLGMRRLSIIDIAGGHQPIANENGQVQVVCNGEIYNFRDLRTVLRGRGHVFSTNSDTEAIVHSYEEKGPECLDDLRGMYAIAIWDKAKQRLLLARDRMGKKPLFYSYREGRLLFGSEIKAILAVDPTLSEQDPAALLLYFRFGFVPGDGTMFRYIRKLPPAHWLIHERGDIQTRSYWQLNFAEMAADSTAEPSRVVEQLDALLEDAVRVRLVSDVPLGVFLSGGLDSSTIVAYAHKAGLRPLKTFTIGFDRQEWDEKPDAHTVAQHFQTEHHILTLRERDLAARLPDTLLKLVYHFDEPFGDSSSLPTYYVSKLARQHATVILSGDGGDELFCGYSSYRGIKFAEYYRRLPVWLGKNFLPDMMECGANWLPPPHRYKALRAAKVLRDSQFPFEEMYFSKASLCRDDVLRALFSGDFLQQLTATRSSAYLSDVAAIVKSNLPVLTKASHADLRFGLLDDMLVKVDRMSMAHSLEVRSPLLDHHLVEFVASLPPSLKLRGWQNKAILRDTVRQYLPPVILRKRKQGFRVPLREWLRTNLHDLVGDYLESRNGRLPPDVFDRSTVRNLLSQHRRGVADRSPVIWLLLNYAAWYDLYICRRAFTPASGEHLETAAD